MKPVFFYIILLIGISLPPSYSQNFSSKNPTLEDTAIVNQINLQARQAMRIDPDSASLLAEKSMELSKQILKNISDKVLKKDLHPLMISIGTSYNVIGTSHYLKGEYEKALLFYDLALKTRTNIKDSLGITASLGNIGSVYMKKGDYEKAFSVLDEAYNTDKELGNKRGMVYHLSNIGNLHNVQGNYPTALEYYFKSLQILEELDNKSEIARALMGIAVVYDQQGEDDKALENYKKSLKINLETNNVMLAANNRGAIGLILLQKKNYQEALIHFEQALKTSEELESMENVGIWLCNIALAYEGLGDVSANAEEQRLFYNKALKYAQRALSIDDEIGNQNETAIDLCTIGLLLTKTGQADKAESFLKKALDLATKLESLEYIKNSHEGLFELYTKTGKDKLALDSYKKFIATRDSIFNEENTKRSVQAQMLYEFDKKEAATKSKQDKKDALANEEKKKQAIIRNSFITGFALILILAILIFRGYRNKQKANLIITQQKEEVEKAKETIEQQKHIVEEKQKEILDSIYYARRIQRALITSEHYIAKKIKTNN